MLPSSLQNDLCDLTGNRSHSLLPDDAWKFSRGATWLGEVARLTWQHAFSLPTFQNRPLWLAQVTAMTYQPFSVSFLAWSLEYKKQMQQEQSFLSNLSEIQPFNIL